MFKPLTSLNPIDKSLGFEVVKQQYESLTIVTLSQDGSFGRHELGLGNNSKTVSSATMSLFDRSYDNIVIVHKWHW